MSAFSQLAAEALQHSEGVAGEQDVEKQIEAALACPCLGEAMLAGAQVLIWAVGGAVLGQSSIVVDRKP